ncbi:MAG: dienelactone hydrolase family protein [Alphaproteobacteria bacterium]|nr:dienelactone hydrolase family protein [Alphaproteobacteria bacterium]MBU0796012.1 dienelactone hydrolase family protein [Alphaproteobacteria bacterium]MBU0886852.1 dienelactone hydrolase family protein [Alphaproteobacteria bacterium]MBU1812405.1 dienelactone hydrolase family protein [Alphaproteobacteria bacterium]MBU2090324.1 dienelactone hydrolase family protein [Alphaproteobacteria bacterium]
MYAMARAAVCAGLFGVLVVAFTAPVKAETVANLADGRSGPILFPSVTPSGPSQFLAGDAPASVISGTLTFPEGAGGGTAERLPAMVISHGSGGILPDREPVWAERLRKLGVATFVVDSFGPRGIASTGADQSRLPLAASVADALHALRLLATHPRIDPARIGVIGFSKGGQVALYTALEPFRGAVMAGGDERFALHVALYASCSIPYMAEPVSTAPILLLLGGADDYTPSAHCARYVDWLRARGGDVSLTVLEGAHHGFDLPSPPRFLQRVQSARGCGMDILLDPVEARLWTDGRVLRSDEIDAYLRGCMQRGGTFGGDPGALAQAIGEVEAAVNRLSAR